MRYKSDATELFEQCPADTRADGVPSKVIIVRSDGGGEFKRGSLETCGDREEGINDGRQSPIRCSSRARTNFDRPQPTQRGNRRMRCGMAAPPPE